MSTISYGWAFFFSPQNRKTIYSAALNLSHDKTSNSPQKIFCNPTEFMQVLQPALLQGTASSTGKHTFWGFGSVLRMPISWSLLPLVFIPESNPQISQIRHKKPEGETTKGHFFMVKAEEWKHFAHQLSLTGMMHFRMMRDGTWCLVMDGATLQKRSCFGLQLLQHRDEHFRPS